MWALYYRLCYFFFPLLFFWVFSLPGFFSLEEFSPLSPVLDEAFSVGTLPCSVGTLPWLGIWFVGLVHQTSEVQLSAGVGTPAAWTGSGGADEGVSVGTAKLVLCSVEPELVEIGSVSCADSVYSAASVSGEELLVD